MNPRTQRAFESWQQHDSSGRFNTEDVRASFEWLESVCNGMEFSPDQLKDTLWFWSVRRSDVIARMRELSSVLSSEQIAHVPGTGFLALAAFDAMQEKLDDISMSPMSIAFNVAGRWIYEKWCSEQSSRQSQP